MAVTATPSVSQWAEITSTAEGLPTDRPMSAHAGAIAPPGSAFMGLP